MPFGAPGTLKDEQYIDVLAFLLNRNGFQPGTRDLVADVGVLKQVQLAGAVTIEHANTDYAPPPRSQLTTLRSIDLGAGPTQAELSGAGSKTTDWLFTNHDYSGQRYVDLKQINRSNVGKLRPVCLYQVGDTNPFPTNPLIYGGSMFITSRNSTVSLDATTCRMNWRYDRISRVPLSYGMKMNRGAAIKDGKLIYGTHDGFLIALNASTGKLIWERDVADATKSGGGFNMAPVVYEDLVVIGPAGSDLGTKGWVGAFKLSTGEPVWRFNTVPEDGEAGAETWPSAAARKVGGGAVWGSLTLDTETGRLYIPVSNPTPFPDNGTRAGDNLYTGSMIVLDVRTGKLIWYSQLTPHDTHDYDLTQASPQFTTKIDGKDRQVVVSVGKEGLLHAFDRQTHELLYKAPVTTRQNTDKPWIAMDKTATGERVCPGAQGGVLWSGPAFNPITNALYVPAVDWCALTSDPPETSRGWITALDAATGAVRWKYQSIRPMLAGVTTTSAGLVFSGELTGDLLALDARDGKVLYRFDTGGPMTGGVVTYEVGKKQYVAAVSGAINSFWRMPPGGSSTVVIFALP